MPTYEGVLRALMTGPHFKMLQNHDAHLGGLGRGVEHDEARGAGTKHTWAGLRGALEGASLQETWLTGVWRGEEEDEVDEEEGAAMPTAVANWLKAHKLVVAAEGTTTQGRAPARGAARGAAGQTAVGGNGARAGERRDPRGELAGVRLLPAPRVDLSESEAPGWCLQFSPGTSFDRFVADFGHAAFIVAEGTGGLSGLTSEDFANLMARNDKGVAPGYRDALKAQRPAGVTVLHGFAARVAGNAKMPLSAGIVAEIAERYFAAFEAILSASAVTGAADRAGPISPGGADEDGASRADGVRDRAPHLGRGRRSDGGAGPRGDADRVAPAGGRALPVRDVRGAARGEHPSRRPRAGRGADLRRGPRCRSRKGGQEEAGRGGERAGAAGQEGQEGVQVRRRVPAPRRVRGRRGPGRLPGRPLGSRRSALFERSLPPGPTSPRTRPRAARVRKQSDAPVTSGRVAA